jgi:hypothetical protein
MLLTDIILQCARTHSFRQWLHSRIQRYTKNRN